MTSTKLKRAACLTLFAFLLAFVSFAWPQDGKPVRIGLVTFMSGPGAGLFGVPARNAAELTFEALNAGIVPAPYQTKGFGGRPAEVIVIDEAGGTSRVVTDYRNLVQRRSVELVIGHVSSGNCLAVAPVAEELRMLTVFFTCGTPRLFEDSNYRYVFRTASHSAMDNIAAAMYVKENLPRLSRIAGINQNYAWGQDAWRDFEASMKTLVPGVQVTTSQMPKLFAGQFGAEISALLGGRPEMIHSSLFGSDLEAFILQAVPRNLFKTSQVLFIVGETVMHKLASKIPDGTIIGARGPHGVLAPDNALNRWFRNAYEKRYGAAPIQPSYHMVQAILGIKAAYERAKTSAQGRDPDREQIVAAFEYLSFETPSGTTRMALGKGHQGIQGTAYGQTKLVDGQITLVNVRRYSAEQVNPPDGVTSGDWIKSGFTRR